MNKDNKKELIEFLRDPKLRASVIKTDVIRDSLTNIHNLSDFDVFNSLCENLYLFVGNKIRTRFFTLIKPYLMKTETYEFLYILENRRAVWKRIFGIDYNDGLICCDFENNVEDDLYIKNKDSKKMFFIDSAIDTSFDSVFELLKGVLETIKDQGAEFLYIDLTKISYIRPDDFHAEEAYSTLKNKKDDASLIELWLMCRVLMNTDLKLVLVTDSLKKVEDITELVFRLRLSPKIIISVDLFADINIEALYSFIIEHKEKSISVSFFATEEMQIDNVSLTVEKIKSVFCCLPMLFIDEINVNSNILISALKDIASEHEINLAVKHLYRVK